MKKKKKRSTKTFSLLDAKRIFEAHSRNSYGKRKEKRKKKREKRKREERRKKEKEKEKKEEKVKTKGK